MAVRGRGAWGMANAGPAGRGEAEQPWGRLPDAERLLGP